VDTRDGAGAIAGVLRARSTATAYCFYDVRSICKPFQNERISETVTAKVKGAYEEEFIFVAMEG
jgi:hypothetical protein